MFLKIIIVIPLQYYFIMQRTHSANAFFLLFFYVIPSPLCAIIQSPVIGASNSLKIHTRSSLTSASNDCLIGSMLQRDEKGSFINNIKRWLSRGLAGVKHF